MTKKERQLASELLEIASDAFMYHGCNDFDLPESWSQEECDEFTLAMQTWNGDPENHEPGRRMTIDWFVMSYLAAMLAKEASESV